MHTLDDLPRPWGPSERAWDLGDVERWVHDKMPVRSYEDDVLARLDRLPSDVIVEPYGPEHVNFRRVKVGSWNSSKPKILITGGVHGYEVSGVDGALTFIERDAPHLISEFDFLVYPCINPVGYAFDMRWNFEAQDTNRHFCRDPQQTESGRPAFECVAFMDSIDNLGVKFVLAHDLHETTDSDLIFRQEKIFRDGKTDELNTVIPQGFYLVLNKSDEGSEIGPRIIEEVSKYTRIAEESIILGVENKGGIVYLDLDKYPGLCMNYTPTPNRITTEVYPNIISQEEAVQGQIASIHGALNHLRLCA